MCIRDRARAVTKDMVYENAYIVSNDDGRLIFICDGELYRAKEMCIRDR